MCKKQYWQGDNGLSSTNTFRQVGLLIGLAASVAIGAAVVLWLWMPGGDESGGQNYGRLNSSANYMNMSNKYARLSTHAGYRDKNIDFISIESDSNYVGRQLTLSGAQLEYTQRLEASFTQRIERLLEPLLGAESIRAQVTADIDFTTREQTLETYNPDSKILRNTELEEQVKGSEGKEDPGVLKNLRREVNSYELDKTIRLTKSAIGRIDKLHIAVIVDDKLSRGVKGNVIRTPHTENELVKFEDLVKKAVGFNAKRGDVVNVIGASFKINRSPGYQLQNNTHSTPTWNQVWLKDLFNKMLGTSLVLLLIFAVIRPAMKSLVSFPGNSITKLSEGGSLYNSDPDGFGSNASGGQQEANDQGNYEKNMSTAARVVERDPKLVAQIMKNWVSADGT
jgi:flagellar M-ring protein FliF